MNNEVNLEDIVSLAKRRGFVFQGSEVYGGLAGTWDYGPLGVTLKRNITNLWWNTFVESRDDMYGVDASIIMNPKVWQASGHVDTFTDPLVECSECKGRFRADKLINMEKYRIFLNSLKKSEKDPDTILKAAEINEPANAIHYAVEANKQAESYIGPAIKYYLNKIEKLKCPSCNKVGFFEEPRQFNMMFKTNVGPVDDESSIAYLRPETAQGIFTNYKNIVDTLYPDLPFGVAQIGKAFRNEISPRDFIFRSREFEQMEIEYFVHPDKWQQSFEALLADIHAFLDALGLPKNKVHELEVPDGDRAHYSKRTIDIEFDFPIGREELLGLAYRTDFDLSNIQRVSGKNMQYTVKGSNEKFVPHVIEPSFGVERVVMAVLTSAYKQDEINGEQRVYLALPEHLAPVKYAVSPLLKNKPELVAKAREVYVGLKQKQGAVMWDDNGNIGKRYRRQDEIGTPYCVVIDFDTLEDNTVTIRNRDTTEQSRVKIEELLSF